MDEALGCGWVADSKGYRFEVLASSTIPNPFDQFRRVTEPTQQNSYGNIPK